MPEVFVKDNNQENTQPEEDDPIKTYLEWNALARPFRKKHRSYFTTIAIIAVLLLLIFLLAQNYLLMGVVIAVCFVAYVLGLVPPEEVKYRLSSQGVTIGDQFFHWQELDSFWFNSAEGQRVLNISTNLRFPARLMVILGPTEEEEVKKVVAKHLPFHEIAPKSTLDKWSESLVKHFPLENPHFKE